MEKNSSNKRFFTALNKTHYALRLLSRKERVIVFILAISAAISFLGTIQQINAQFSYLVPAIGGSLREGVVGSPHFINPVLAISDSDRDMTSLVYSGLMRPDGKGDLVLDLAQAYEISPDGLSYTFAINPEAKFHDGEPITADDVIFTVGLAKNPAVKSPSRANWEGVEIEKINDTTVRFWLKRPYAPFLENTALGIIPKHIWKDIRPEQISLSDFNSKPIGSGPYKIDKITRNSSSVITSYTLTPFGGYIPEAPFIKKITLVFYPSEVELINAYDSGEVDAISAVSPQNIAKITRDDGRLETLALPRVFGVFFNQNEKTFFTEKHVREALAFSTNKQKIINEVFQNYAISIDSPIPRGTFGAIATTELPYDLEKARALLEKNSWKRNEETGIYQKIEKGKVVQELTFSISTSNSPELVRVANILKSDWEMLGAKVTINVFEIFDLNQNVIRPRKYDALLFGEVVGRDPDPFAFWHSSQRNDPGLNIALYTNRSVDRILEEARSITSAEERKKKYEEFQEEVIADMPAIFLYSPYFLYILPIDLKGFDTEHIIIPSERFANISGWHFDSIYVWNIFKKDAETTENNEQI